ncbi:CidA/LrgA family protein [Thalassobaculum fulvum]|uniref:CidA/LrgA family protein n=1 Tax=Thalassobaculum fulvum TaxID=1633335 RepID=A0A918XRM0_9PROT|nr:CidA/LrgA family protein [Thalassobaculum fulvum]GHD48190.1 CidA/LrgA family protein [Thalassobaculum fulvum]
MIESLTLLLVCQLAGEVIVGLFRLPIPGPVLGMVFLFAGLLVRGGVPQAMQTTAGTLLSHFSLLFVPAGVGVMLHLGRLEDAWLAIGVALIASTLVAVAVTALAMLGLERLAGRRGSPEGGPS